MYEDVVGISIINTSVVFIAGCSSMDVNVASSINALNGTTVKIACVFTSCYKMDTAKFDMNWTYQETANDTEDMVMWLVLIGSRAININLGRPAA